MATFYVDAVNGSDASDGLATSRAWQTVNRVNTALFTDEVGPGDVIRFRTGQTWRESIQITGSGAEGSPILFGAWGADSGRPSIRGSDPMGAFWDLEGGTSQVYSQPLTWEPAAVWEEETAALDPVASIAAADAAPGSWFFDSGAGRLYISTSDGSNPNTNGRAYEVGRRDTVVELIDADWIAIEQLELRHNNTAARGMLSHLVTADRTGLSIHDCEFLDAWGRGAWWSDDMPTVSQFFYRELSILRNDFRRTGGGGLAASQGSGEVGYNTFRNCCDREHEPWQAGIRFVTGFTEDLDIHHNDVRDQRRGYGGASQAGIHIDEVGSGVVARWNVVDNVENAAMMIENTAGGVVAFRNQLTRGHAGLWLHRASHHARIYHNVCWANRSQGIVLQGLNEADPNPAVLIGGELMTDNIIANNIAFANPDANLKATGGAEIPANGNLYLNNNFGFRDYGDGLSYIWEWGEGVAIHTYADWYAAAGASQADTVEGDPLVVDAEALNFDLLPQSPLIDAGLPLPGYNDDFEGLAPDIGILEHSAPTMVVGGVDLATFGFGVRSRDFPRFGGEVTRERKIPGRIGTIRIGGDIPSRTLRVVGLVKGADHADMIANIEALSAAIQGEQSVRFWDYPDREWLGRLQMSGSSIPIGHGKVNRVEEVALEWLLVDPRARARTPTTISSGSIADAGEWYGSVDLGTAPSDMIVTITIGTTPATWVGIRTRRDTYTQVEAFEWAGSVLGAGSQLILDTAERTVRTGGGVNLIGGMQPSSTFPALDPALGIDTVSVDLIGGDDSTIQVEYRKRYW